MRNGQLDGEWACAQQNQAYKKWKKAFFSLKFVYSTVLMSKL